MAPETSDSLIASALATASDTREVLVGRGLLAQTPEVFRRQFGDAPAMLVADTNTLRAAGGQVLHALTGAGLRLQDPFIFSGADLHAEEEHVLELQDWLGQHDAIPIAVGSGTINDLTKLAAHRCGRRYMVVGTAASMDGYAAYGASITAEGSKQTFDCPAPVVVLADLDVIAAAPAEMNAAGYADLIAKTAAGADWLLADALLVEPLQPHAWRLVQTNLREWVANPQGVRGGEPQALRGLTQGLIMSGLAMQAARSSRPASGADHQFSHLWDMQDHRHEGRVPFHGFKVGIGTIASSWLYEQLFRQDVESLNIEELVAAWPAWEEVTRQVEQTHVVPELRRNALKEMRAKYVDADGLRALLTRLKAAWPTLQPRLRQQLLTPAELRDMLARAGAPSVPSEIGIDLPRLRRSFLEAQQIRRRFTVLDVATMSRLLPACLDALTGPEGPWPECALS